MIEGGKSLDDSNHKHTSQNTRVEIQNYIQIFLN